jgi:hypothetical protein
MTVIDLLVVAVISYGMWRSRLILPGMRFERARIGCLVINFGLLAVALFYVADLMTMYVLPMVTSTDEPMQAMEFLHGTLRRLVILFVTISIPIGFVELLLELQRRQAALREKRAKAARNRVGAFKPRLRDRADVSVGTELDRIHLLSNWLESAFSCKVPLAMSSTGRVVGTPLPQNSPYPGPRSASVPFGR